jgi:hypothetical protein
MVSRAADAVSAVRRPVLLTAALAVVGVAVALVALGRWERARQVDSQVAGMERIRRAVGPLDQPSLTGYRVLPQFDCLVYRRGANPYALELCVDRAGRLVEAIDRRTAARHYPTLRAQQSESPLRVDRAEVDRLLRRMGAPKP